MYRGKLSYIIVINVPWKTFLHHRDQCTVENFLTSSLLMYRGKITVFHVSWKTYYLRAYHQYKRMNIDGDHTIDIIHRVDHQN